MKKSTSFTMLCGLLLSVFSLISMYIFPGVVKRCTSKAIVLCGKSVIPSLFPYIVLTRIVLHFAVKFKRKASHTSSGKGMSPYGYTALFAGLLSGAPTGAVLAGQMYSQGLLERSEAEKIAAFSCVASPAFCINFFGADIVGKRSIGLLLYLAQVTVNLLLLVVSNVALDTAQNDRIDIQLSEDKEDSSVSSIIHDSCMTMLGICAYVTFFMCTGEVLYTVISYLFGDNTLFKAFFIGFAEMTSGVSVTAGLALSEKIMCASAITGFGGLSVMMQTVSICALYGLGCGRIFVIKLVSAFAVPFMMFLFTVISERSNFSLRSCAIPIILLTVFAFLIYFVRKIPKKYKKSKVNL